MKSIKMSLENVSSALSRSEMKSILGGYGCNAYCQATSDCPILGCGATSCRDIQNGYGKCS